MNHVYRLKRSGRTQQLQPVPETARSAGKGSRTGKTLAQTVGGTLVSFALSGMASLTHAQQAPPAVNQLPQGAVVTRGTANIVSSTSGNTALMSVNQSSQRAVIDWASFNVGSQAKVQFKQPSSSAVTLNNILGNNASQIYGQISANGQVFLSNPNGVYFSPTAQVNVGGLVATTGKERRRIHGGQGQLQPQWQHRQLDQRRPTLVCNRRLHRALGTRGAQPRGCDRTSGHGGPGFW
jgi:filamentous hemagglutinin family protein